MARTYFFGRHVKITLSAPRQQGFFGERTCDIFTRCSMKFLPFLSDPFARIFLIVLLFRERNIFFFLGTV